MSEIRDKIRFLKRILKEKAILNRNINFSYRRSMALAHGTQKEYFLKPYTFPEINLPKELARLNTTSLYIIYNRLRETNRPHLGSQMADNSFIKEHKNMYEAIERILEEEFQKEMVCV